MGYYSKPEDPRFCPVGSAILGVEGVSDMGTRNQEKPKRSRKRPRKAKPWERQPGETFKQFEAFTLYRDGTQRTIASTARVLGSYNADTVGIWARKWGWEERAYAWDNEVDRRLRNAESEELRSMRKRQVQIGIGMQKAATHELQALVKYVEHVERKAQASGVIRKPFVSVRDIVRLVDTGTRLERLNMGEPGAIIDVRDPEKQQELDALSKDELKAYKSLLEKMRRD